MSYTPPAGDSVAFDLTEDTPGLAGDSLEFDLGATGFDGVISYAPAAHVVLTAPPPVPRQESAAAMAALFLSAPPPVSSIFVTTVIGAPTIVYLSGPPVVSSASASPPTAVLTITAPESTNADYIVTEQTDFGAISVASGGSVGQLHVHSPPAASVVLQSPPVTPFAGTATQLTSSGGIVLAGPGPVALMVHTPEEGVVVMSAPQVTSAVYIHSLAPSASLILTAGEVGHKMRVYTGVAVPYVLGDTTELTEAGVVAVSAPAPAWGLLIRASVQLHYNMYDVVRRGFTLPYTNRVFSAVDTLYNVRGLVERQAGVVYTIRDTTPVQASLGAAYSLRVGAALSTKYRIAASSVVSAAVATRYGILETTKVASAVSAKYSLVQNTRVLAASSFVYSYATPVRNALAVTYNMPLRVLQSIAAVYGVNDFDRIARELKTIYSVFGDTVVINLADQPYITVDGVRVEIVGGDVSSSEGGYAWECTLYLVSLTDYARFKRDTPFTVNLYGEVYSFITDGRDMNRSAPAEQQAQITGISPSALLSTPRAPLNDYLWDTPKKASEIVAEVTGGAVPWTLVDWTLPAYRVSFTKATPLDVVQKLAEVAGGTVYSTKDGALRVRPMFPVTVPDYDTTTPDHVYLEGPHILSASESNTYDPVYNKYRLVDVDNAMADTLEWIADTGSPRKGTMRAYPSPWRTTVSLLHTGDPGTYIGPATYTETLVEDEVVEIYEGQGAVAKPIHQIVSMEWLAVDLGGLAFAQDSREVTATGGGRNSLVRLSYRTRSLDYVVVSPNGDPTQFLLQSLD